MSGEKSEQTVGEEGEEQQQQGEEGEDGKNLPKAMMLSPSSSLDHLVFFAGMGGGREREEEPRFQVNSAHYLSLSLSLPPSPSSPRPYSRVFWGLLDLRVRFPNAEVAQSGVPTSPSNPTTDRPPPPSTASGSWELMMEGGREGRRLAAPSYFVRTRTDRNWRKMGASLSSGRTSLN